DLGLERRLSVRVEGAVQRGAAEAGREVVGGDRVRAVLVQAAVVAVSVRRGPEVVEGKEGVGREGEDESEEHDAVASRRVPGHVILPALSRISRFIGAFLFVASFAYAQEDPALWRAYYDAVRDSAIYNPAKLRPLKPLVPDANGNVLVVALGASAYTAGTIQTSSDIWVTLVPEVQTLCRPYGA